jgi:hypothetical protein
VFGVDARRKNALELRDRRPLCPSVCAQRLGHGGDVVVDPLAAVGDDMFGHRRVYPWAGILSRNAAWVAVPWRSALEKAAAMGL